MYFFILYNISMMLGLVNLLNKVELERVWSSKDIIFVLLLVVLIGLLIAIFAVFSNKPKFQRRKKKEYNPLEFVSFEKIEIRD